ncbi:MAG: uroporphyrinogen-III synthase [Terracidiphilus sp.]
MNALPLAGKRVLVTRAAHQAGKLSDGLRALGAEPVEVPVLEILPPESFAALDAALRQIATYDWLILTSANAVLSLMERGAALGVSLEQFQHLQVAVVGEATAAAGRKAGLPVTVVPESYVAESLVAALGERTAARRVLLARAAVARDVIPDALRVSGATVGVADAYRNAIPAGAQEQLRQASKMGIDAATFTSSSSVTHLADVVREAGLDWPLAGVKAVSIGPITSETLRASGWEPASEADPHDIPGLVAAVSRTLAH